MSARRVARRLRESSNDQNPRDPQTWREVAERLSIGVYEYNTPSALTGGQLVYVSAADRWVIEANNAGSAYRLARVLVHELAHYLLHNMGPQALCDEEIIYCYKFPCGDMRHQIARRVERLIVG